MFPALLQPLAKALLVEANLSTHANERNAVAGSPVGITPLARGDIRDELVGLVLVEKLDARAAHRPSPEQRHCASFTVKAARHPLLPPLPSRGYRNFHG